jgi:hypothetical protein
MEGCGRAMEAQWKGNGRARSWGVVALSLARSLRHEVCGSRT